jgi:hypothetical protein
VTGVKMAENKEVITGLQEKAGKQTILFSIIYQFSVVAVRLYL